MRHFCCAAGCALPLLASGCSASPSQDILGSFFPAWMLCAVVGVFLAVLVYQALRVIGVAHYVVVPPLTYLCIAAAGTLSLWLTWFGH
jgi:hypothetical protein